MNPRRLEGRTALITGAGTGIGRELALGYAREGARVALGARRLELLEETRALVEAEGGECLTRRADVSRERDCVDLVAAALDRFGRLDVLVNNAGAPGTDQRVAEMTLDNWNETFAINVTGPMLLSREALRQAMVAQRSGNIQFFSSAAAKRIRPRKGHYAVAKMGLIPLAQTLALEVGELGIRVNTIVVGLVAGDLVDRWIARTASESGRDADAVRAALVADIPLRRALDPREVVELSLFLASDASSAITGQDINVTNGAEMR
jgi:glucose 1-dehydrogenase